MNKAAKIVLFGSVIAAAGAVGYQRLHTTAPATVIPGRQVTVKTGDIKVAVSESGTLEPVTEVEVKSKVAGRVQRILVQEGQIIHAGDLIALIDPTEVSRDVDQIKAQLQSAQAEEKQAQENFALTQKQSALSVLRAEAALREAQTRRAQAAAPTRPQEVAQQEEAVRRAEAALTRSDAALRRADAQIADARRNQERQNALVTKGFVAQSVADTAQTNVQFAEADKAAQVADRESLVTDLASARKRLSLLKEGPRREDVAAADATVASARVALDVEKANRAQAQLRARDIERASGSVRQIENQLGRQSVALADTRIVAPISGEITAKLINAGELVASATGGFAQGAALVRVADLSRMQVRVNINEIDVAKLHVGLPVEIHVDSVPDKVLQGRVAAIAPSALGSGSTSGSGSSGSSAVVRYEVKIAVLSADSRLRPGMSASVDIVESEKKNVLTLPAEAVRAGNQVAVVVGSGDQAKTQERTIAIGLRNDAVVEVKSGLRAGDKVEVPKVEATGRRKMQFGPG